MTTNKERAAEVIEGYYPPCQTCRARATVGIPEVGECDECAKECQYIAQALADAGLLAPDPQIVRTFEEVLALSPDAVMIDSENDTAMPHDYIGPDGEAVRIFINDLPAVVVASGDPVRAARRALEQEKK